RGRGAAQRDRRVGALLAPERDAAERAELAAHRRAARPVRAARPGARLVAGPGVGVLAGIDAVARSMRGADDERGGAAGKRGVAHRLLQPPRMIARSLTGTVPSARADPGNR